MEERASRVGRLAVGFDSPQEKERHANRCRPTNSRYVEAEAALSRAIVRRSYARNVSPMFRKDFEQRRPWRMVPESELQMGMGN